MFRKRIFGKTLVVNLNAKRGYRISPGKNSIAMAIQEECKGIKGRDNARKCFGAAAKDAAKAAGHKHK